MKIEIHYQRHSKNEPGILALTPEEYFDPLEDEDENFEDHGIAKFNHDYEYLELNVEELKWSDIRIQHTKNDYNIRTEYYIGGHWMWHRKDSDGNEEMCLVTQISDSKQQIIRLHKIANSNWQINYSGIFEELPDDSEKEKIYVTFNNGESKSLKLF